MNTNVRWACSAAAVLAVAGGALGQIAQWNFNSNPSDASASTGTLIPNIGTGTASLLGGVTGSFASGDANGGSTDPLTGSPTDDSGWGITTFAAQGAQNGERGVQFALSTVGYINIVVTWDLRFSNTSNRFYQFQYTLDSSQALPTWNVFQTYENVGGGDFWANNNSADLSAILGANNNPNFAFRIVSVFGPGGAYVASNPTSTYATSGTWRFDMVTVVPAPGAAALLGVGGLIAGRRRR